MKPRPATYALTEEQKAQLRKEFTIEEELYNWLVREVPLVQEGDGTSTSRALIPQGVTSERTPLRVAEIPDTPTPYPPHWMNSEPAHYQAGPSRTAWTPDKAIAVLECVRAGNYLPTALKLARVGPDSCMKWLFWAQKGYDPFRLFALELLAAEAEAESRILRELEKQGKTWWGANAWILEHRFGNRWRRQPDSEQGTLKAEVSLKIEVE